ncbi:Zn-ribbon domain-containing OB-fold protein [Nonomuraea lactucae]|uniref:Zn-ribbon domain-containing OB-fold protein n=1 Tax=Nonomuraea lactucae TaxID=2249762 RepID=UPI001F07033B|nr:OB-fold domain-containing protein [Nonomuraea lactucae]
MSDLMPGPLRGALTPDRDSAPWWERVRRREFAVQRCDTCRTPRFPARAFCPACRTERWHWEAVEPEGTVESWIVNRRAFGPGDGRPYVVVMVRLAGVPGCLLYGSWEAPSREPVGGERVRGVFVGPAGEGPTLVGWEPVVR